MNVQYFLFFLNWYEDTKFTVNDHNNYILQQMPKALAKIYMLLLIKKSQELIFLV